MSLDERYGENGPPGGSISEVEHKFRPISLQKLDDTTAPTLKQYILTTNVLTMPKVIHSYSVILWLIDVDGSILFAIEELVDATSGLTVAARPRGDYGRIAGTDKLGHPSLLDDPEKRARLGGEILFDRLQGCWTINRFSGRYGNRPGQAPHHLEAAAERFKEFGIEFEIDHGVD